MREDVKRRQRAYWEIAAAMVTLGYRAVTAGDIEEIARRLEAGHEPTSPAGLAIAGALRNYFGDGGDTLKVPTEDEVTETPVE